MLIKKNIKDIPESTVVRKWRLHGNNHLLPESDNYKYICFNCGNTITDRDVIWKDNTIVYDDNIINGTMVLSFPYCSDKCITADEL